MRGIGLRLEIEMMMKLFFGIIIFRNLKILN